MRYLIVSALLASCGPNVPQEPDTYPNSPPAEGTFQPAEGPTTPVVNPPVVPPVDPPPPADTDGDGVVDTQDACPAVFAETVDGCPLSPPPPDADGDGVPDASDACPSVFAETADGCPLPPPDSDGDGVPDSEDACPDVFAETADGCPLPPPDSDGDGVPDSEDSCPDVFAETADGCPPAPVCDHPTVVEDCTDGWCTIPAGCFGMAIDTTPTCGPATTTSVEISYSFEMMQLEVTWGEYGGAGVASNPVERVSWHDAAEYCNELSYRLDLCYECVSGACTQVLDPSECNGYRLPTEAEWEYAYRAGTTTDTYNGDLDSHVTCMTSAATDDIGWYFNNAGGHHYTGGQKLANAWGIYDLGGNVSEWVDDIYEPSASDDIIVDPIGTQDGQSIGTRGGSFAHHAYATTAYFHTVAPKTTHDIYYGFRCVRTLGLAEPPPE